MVPAISPQFSNTVNDNSALDESISQGDLTITAGAGSVINTNSGNDRPEGGSAKHNDASQFMQRVFFCVITCGFIWWLSTYCNNAVNAKVAEIHDELHQFQLSTQKSIHELHDETKQALDESKKAVEESKKSINESKEGTIWILRRDILNSIELYESTKTITQKQYKRIKDQYEYYHSIGGNHDVKGRFEDFNIKIFGTNAIRMITGEEVQKK